MTYRRGLLVKLALAVGAGAVVAAAWAAGHFFGFTGFAFAWTVHFAMMAWMSAALDVTQPPLTGSWYRVRRWEPAIYRRLGVWRYLRLLRWIGWERAMRGNRRFDGSRAQLSRLERHTRMSEFGHGVLAAVGTILVVVAAAFRAWQAVAWLFGLNVVLHLYPILLQRVVRARIDRVRARFTRG